MQPCPRHRDLQLIDLWRNRLTCSVDLVSRAAGVRDQLDQIDG